MSSKQNNLSMRGRIQMASVRCLRNYLDSIETGAAIKEAMGADRVFDETSILGDSASRRTLTVMDASAFLSLASQINVSDGGFPEVITELSSDNGETALRVVGMRNMETASRFDGSDDIPVVLSLHGPQSLPGTGIFSLMRDGDLPKRIVSADGHVSVPTRGVAVSMDSLDMAPEILQNTAAAIEGIISISTCTPIHHSYADNPIAQSAAQWAARQDIDGVMASSMSDYECMVKATQIADRFRRQAMGHGLPAKSASVDNDHDEATEVTQTVASPAQPAPQPAPATQSYSFSTPQGAFNF